MLADGQVIFNPETTNKPQTGLLSRVVKTATFWKKFSHYFIVLFSFAILAVIGQTSLISGTLLEGPKPASAEARGLLGSILPNNNGASWTAKIENHGTTYKAGDKVAAEYKAFHCKTKGSAACATDLTNDATLVKHTEFEINVPASGEVYTRDFDGQSISCGRMQADIGLRDGHGEIVTGHVFDTGVDCPTDQPNTPSQPTVPSCPNFGAPANLKIDGNVSGHTFPAGAREVTLSWSAVDGATYYDFRLDDPTTTGSGKEPDIAVRINQTSIRIPLSNPTTYSFWIHAGKEGCENGPQANAQFKISAPTGGPAQPGSTPTLTGTPSCVNNNPVIDWNWNIPAGWDRYDFVAPGTNILNAPVSETTRSFRSTNLGANQTYEARVTVRNSAHQDFTVVRATAPNCQQPNQPSNPTNPVSCVSLVPSKTTVKQVGDTVSFTANINGTWTKAEIWGYTTANVDPGNSDQGWHKLGEVTPSNRTLNYTTNAAELFSAGSHRIGMLVYNGNEIVNDGKNNACRTTVNFVPVEEQPNQISCVSLVPSKTTVKQIGDTFEVTANVNTNSGWTAAEIYLYTIANAEPGTDPNNWTPLGVATPSDKTISFTTTKERLITPGSHRIGMRIMNGNTIVNAGTLPACRATIHIEAENDQPTVTLEKFVIVGSEELTDVAESKKKYGQSEEVKYRVKINVSNTAAKSVVVKDTLPSYLETSSVSGASVSGKTITWNLGDLSTGTKTLDYTVKVASSIPAGTTEQLNSVVLTATNVGTITDQSKIFIHRDAQNNEPVINVSKTVNRSNVNVNETVEYTIAITNKSGRSISSIQVIDDLPNGFTFQDGSVSGSTTSNPSKSGNTLTWNGISLNNDAEWKVTFKAHVGGNAGSYVNYVKAIAENKTFGPASATVTVGAQGTVVCPSGTTISVNGSTITCVLGVSTVKELPKTGLPLLAWGAASIIPVGIRLRKYGKNAKGDLSSNPNYIWEERQFKI